MSSTLPEEILDNVLDLYCHIPTNVFFSNINASSPNFSTSTPNQPGSSVLLVSRTFRSIALQYFYTNVIIRSEDRAEALGRSISLDSSKFTRFTRRVRIEGGDFTPEVESLLKLLGPRLEDLCFRVRYPEIPTTLDSYEESVFPPDGFDEVNPLHIGLIDYAHGSGENISEAVRLEPSFLVVRTWTRMHTLYLPPPLIFPDRSDTKEFLRAQNDFTVHSDGSIRVIHLPNYFASMSIVASLAFAMSEQPLGVPRHRVIVHGPEEPANVNAGIGIKGTHSAELEKQDLETVEMMVKQSIEGTGAK